KRAYPLDPEPRFFRTFARGTKSHEEGNSPQVLPHQGLPQRRAGVHHRRNHAGVARGSLVRVAPVLHGEAAVRGLRRPSREVPEEVRRQLLRGQKEVNPAVFSHPKTWGPRAGEPARIQRNSVESWAT